MKRRLSTGLILILLVLASWYMNRDASGPNPSAGSPRSWAVPSQSRLAQLASEPGMKVSAAERKAMDSGTVVRVVDGDTVDLKIGTRTVRARLLNVDTPETVDPRRPVEEYGREASNFTKSVLKEGAKVLYRYEVEKTDRYGRQLLHLYLENGTWFNALLVRAGFAQVATYPPNVSAAAFFRELQQKARAESLGLWQIPEKERGSP